jgi:staphylococcal nuclease domain-containing protein 1
VYDVYFLDFGNRDRVGSGGIRPTPPALAAVPPQAHPAALAFIQAPGLEDDYGVEAAQLLAELVGGGRRLQAVVERRERVAPVSGAAPKGWGAAASASAASAAPLKLHLTILGDAQAEPGAGSDSEGEEGGSSTKAGKPAPSAAESANAKMLAAGLARVVEPRKGAPALSGGAAATLEVLRAAQEGARAAHAGVWEYGDPGDEDDDGGMSLDAGRRPPR